jgi:glycosyltransferase involved in cell wall biosynthesis
VQISVVIITKNEEDNLQLSLPALSWCKDIVVVDDYSSDQTVQVAKSFGANVIQRKFDGFGTQKRFAVEQATNDWILNIDADEVLSSGLIEELKTLDLNKAEAFEIPIRHVFLGRIFKKGKESYYHHLRLFNRNSGNFNEAEVHEKVLIKGPVNRLKEVILHYSYKDLQHYFVKFNAYTEAGAKKLYLKGKSRSLLLILLLSPVYFFKHYIIYGNILNGKEGFIWSYLNAWYHTVKYLKLIELKKNNG